MGAVQTEPIEDLQPRKGFGFPAHVRVRQLLVTGPPGCGKSTFTRNFGGWRSHYVLEFLLTTAQTVFAWRLKRARRGTHHVDDSMPLALIEKQVKTMWLMARRLYRNGLSVCVREGVDGGPMRFVDTTG